MHNSLKQIDEKLDLLISLGEQNSKLIESTLYMNLATYVIVLATILILK